MLVGIVVKVARQIENKKSADLFPNKLVLLLSFLTEVEVYLFFPDSYQKW